MSEKQIAVNTRIKIIPAAVFLKWCAVLIIVNTGKKNSFFK